MKIKADEKLFYEIYEHACKVTRLAGMMQNDMELTPEQYREWAIDGLNATKCIKEWMQKVAKHIKENQ